MKRIRDTYLGQAWLVLILSLVFGGTLAGVHVGLEDRIEANLRAETLSRIPALVLGDAIGSGASVALLEKGIEVRMTDGTELALQVDEQRLGGHQVFEVLREADRTRMGWVARGAGQGYADRIEILIGLDADGEAITGLYVLSQKETPALGDAIAARGFTSRFAGAPTDRVLEVSKAEDAAASDPSKILALTAATISSQSVCDIVNATVADVRPQIARQE